MDAATPIRLKESHTLPEFLAFLSEVNPQIGLLGGRRYHYGNSTKSVSMHAIVSAFEKLSHQTQNGTVSLEIVEKIKRKISYLNREGSRLLKIAPGWKKLFTFIFRISNIRFLFRNPLTPIEKTAREFNNKTEVFLTSLVKKLADGTFTQEDCNKITDPSLYEEFIKKFILYRPLQKSSRMLDNLPLPLLPEPIQKQFKDVSENLKRNLRITLAKEYFTKLAENRHEDDDMAQQRTDFFSAFVAFLFLPENKDFSPEECAVAKQLGDAIERIPLRSRASVCQKTLFPFREVIFNRFSFLVGSLQEKYKRSSPDLSEYMLSLNEYFRSTMYQFPGNSWNHEEHIPALLEAYKEIFSKGREFSWTRPLIFTREEKKLTERYPLANKEKVNAWLDSLPEPSLIIRDLHAELGNGVTIGKKPVTKTILEQEIGKADLDQLYQEDKNCLMCYAVSEKIASYFKDRGVQNPEEATTLLLTVAHQNKPSYQFLIYLGSLLGQSVTLTSLDPHNWIFFVDKKTKTPCVKIHCDYVIRTKRLIGTVTLSVQKAEGTFTERFAFTPAEDLQGELFPR